jgi:hypothetical protein
VKCLGGAAACGTFRETMIHTEVLKSFKRGGKCHFSPFKNGETWMKTFMQRATRSNPVHKLHVIQVELTYSSVGYLQLFFPNRCF